MWRSYPGRVGKWGRARPTCSPFWAARAIGQYERVCASDVETVRPVLLVVNQIVGKGPGWSANSKRVWHVLKATILDTCALLRHGATRAQRLHPLTTYPGPTYNYIDLGDGAQAPS